MVDINRLQKAADAISNAGGLWNFTGNAQSEAMCEQTISASIGNYHRPDRPDRAFSFLSPNASQPLARCGTNNAAALEAMISEGMLTKDVIPADGLSLPDGIEPDDDGNVAILEPTDKLLLKIEAHLA